MLKNNLIINASYVTSAVLSLRLGHAAVACPVLGASTGPLLLPVHPAQVAPLVTLLFCLRYLKFVC